MTKYMIGLVVISAVIASILAIERSDNTFKLSSLDITATNSFRAYAEYNGFGCKGKNQSPELHWENIPAGTKSLALMVHDRDAPTGGSGWWHWQIINIPTSVNMLNRDAGNPKGNRQPTGSLQMRNDFGEKGWGGPCPPVNDRGHRYRMTLYAIKVPHLVIPDDASPPVVGYLVKSNSIAEASLIVTYRRDYQR